MTERQPKVDDRVKVTRYFSHTGERDEAREGPGTVVHVTLVSVLVHLDKSGCALVQKHNGDEWEFIDD